MLEIIINTKLNIELNHMVDIFVYLVVFEKLICLMLQRVKGYGSKRGSKVSKYIELGT